jgi:D-alanyl-lipoteichoic acid acyltransferase DltB (MBOAT superfamily)
MQSVRHYTEFCLFDGIIPQEKKMKTAENIKKVALVFFIGLGLAHILSGLMLSNNYLTPITIIINRVLDIPFAMSAVIYGLATIYCDIDEKKRKNLNIIMITFSILIFLILIYINFLIPDKIIVS